MSADNYLYVTRHPLGGFTFVHGFASDDDAPVARDHHPRFASIHEAIGEAHREESKSYTEYGTSIDPELIDLLTQDPSHDREEIDFVVMGTDGFRSEDEGETFLTLEEAQNAASWFDDIAAWGAPHYVCRRFVEVTYEKVV